jgi:hypothetical protein
MVSNEGLGRVRVRKLTVKMVGTTDVVTRDDADEGSCAVLACWLETTECVGLDGGGRAVTVPFGLDASVDSSGVAAPEFDISVCYRFTP